MPPKLLSNHIFLIPKIPPQDLLGEIRCIDEFLLERFSFFDIDSRERLIEIRNKYEQVATSVRQLFTSEQLGGSEISLVDRNVGGSLYVQITGAEKECTKQELDRLGGAYPYCNHLVNTKKIISKDKFGAMYSEIVVLPKPWKYLVIIPRVLPAAIFPWTIELPYIDNWYAFYKEFIHDRPIA